MVRAILLLAVILILISFSCIKVSGDKSREEERDEVLKKDSHSGD